MKRIAIMVSVALLLLIACTRQAGSPLPPAPPPGAVPVPAGLEIDLNADGVKERITGPLGQWSDQPVVVYDQSGKTLFTSITEQWKRAFVQVLTMPGQDRPALLYQFDPGVLGRDTTLVWFGPDGRSNVTYGWHPKVSEIAAETTTVDADGLVVMTGSLHDPAGHRWERRFRITLYPPGHSQPFWPTATLVSERFEAPAEYPKTAEAVLEAAMIAKAYGLKDELAGYFSDPAAVATFAADKRPICPPYDLWGIQLGKVTLPAKEYEPIKVEPQTPDPKGGTVGFVFTISLYEGGVHDYGTATFDRSPDGRWTIRELKTDGDMWIY